MSTCSWGGTWVLAYEDAGGVEHQWLTGGQGEAMRCGVGEQWHNGDDKMVGRGK